MAYKLLQSKFDEKSGLLLEERSKVTALEEKIQRLESANQSLIESHQEKKTESLRVIEERLESVNDGIDK